MKQSRVIHLESEDPMGTILERHSSCVTRNVAKEGMFGLRKMNAATRAWLLSHAVLWGSGCSTQTKVECKNIPLPPKVFEKYLCCPLWLKGGWMVSAGPVSLPNPPPLFLFPSKRMVEFERAWVSHFKKLTVCISFVSSVPLSRRVAFNNLLWCSTKWANVCHIVNLLINVSEFKWYITFS